MIEGYIVLANRIRKEISDLERVVSRAEQATEAARNRPGDKDFYIDSAALSLHDVYVGLERIFRQIAATVDGSVPSGPQWHRELIQQMTIDLRELRPPVLSDDTVRAVDEFLRFRHVVRNVYAFSLEPERVERLAQKLRPAFKLIRTELLAFVQFLEQVGQE